jgi:protein-S-isoprenylcysteine O-methyltransferase Ste14
MRAVVIVLSIGWVVFWIGWLVAAVTAKASRGSLASFAALRIGVMILLIFFFLFRLNRDVGEHPGVSGPVLAGIGLAVWVAGLAIAVWARLYIGRNWGMPMTRRAEPELVTTGPYRLIRHPIYTGIILALVGTALAISPLGLIAVAVLAVFFAFSATREERFLTEEFPSAYPPYKARTKMLIPFVF